MTPKIKDVQVLENYTLLVTFDNGIQKTFDVREKLSEERFHSLRDNAFFSCVKLDPGGYGVSWDDQVDLSEYEIWEEGELVNTA